MVAKLLERDYPTNDTEEIAKTRDIAVDTTRRLGGWVMRDGTM